MTSSTGDFVLSVQITALIGVLHKSGIAPIQAVIEEMQEIGVAHAIHMKGSPHLSEALSLCLRNMTELAGVLGAFEPR